VAARDDEHPFRLDAEEEAVRKPRNQRSANAGVDDGELKGIEGNPSHQPLHRGMEAIAEAERARVVPPLGLRQLGRGLREKADGNHQETRDGRSLSRISDHGTAFRLSSSKEAFRRSSSARVSTETGNPSSPKLSQRSPMRSMRSRGERREMSMFDT